MMKPVYQTRFGESDGNCFQAAVASLFELKLEEVPNFCNEYQDGWHLMFVRWLRKFGYSAITITVDDLTIPNYQDCYLLVAGVNGEGVEHCVIYKNGKLEFDPHKGGSTINPKYVDIIFPVDPARMIVEKIEE